MCICSFARMPVGRTRKSKSTVGVYPTVAARSTSNIILHGSDEEGNTESDCGRRQVSSVYSTLDSTDNANFYPPQSVISNQPASATRPAMEINRMDFDKVAISNDRQDSSN